MLIEISLTVLRKARPATPTQTMEVWYNPSCSKCRTAKAELDAAGCKYEERRYLDAAPTADEFARILDKLKLQPWDVARPKETKEAGIDFPKDAEHRDEWINAMIANPKSIQRPIIITEDGFAVVARDADTVREAIEHGSK